MKKIKILQVIEGHKLYGAARVVIDIATCVDKKVFEVKVVSFVYSDNKKNELLDYLRSHKCQTETIRVKNHFDSSIVFKLRRLIINYQPDILHTHAYKADIVGFLASRFLNIPIISTVHGFTGASWRVKVYELFDFTILRFFDKIIAVSKAKANSLHRSLCPANKISVIYNGVSSNSKIDNMNAKSTRKKLNICFDVPVIGTIGRLSPEKGYDYLLRAVAGISKELADVRLLILGEGQLDEKLKKQTGKLGIKDKVIFLGFKRNIRPYLGAMDVFVLSSLTEGMPLALLEAMREGKPVVVTDVGGVPEIVKDGYNGLMVEQKNIDALKEAILKLINDQKLAISLSEAASLTIKEKFDINGMISAYESLYKDVASKRQRQNKI